MSETKPLAVITGTSRGLGAELANAFSGAGYNLLCVSRSGERSETSVAADISTPEGVSALRRALGERAIDCLICNAAIQGPIGPFASTDIEEWCSAMNTNLLAQARVVSACLSGLRSSSSASIIMLSGGGATGPRPNFSSYATAKAGLVRFAETLAQELGPSITVNCIAPGPMPTRMLEMVAANPEAGERELVGAKKALSGSSDVFARVCDLALFLASKEAREISGRLISAVWDDYRSWPLHADELSKSDVYTLRRITARDRGLAWGDN